MASREFHRRREDCFLRFVGTGRIQPYPVLSRVIFRGPGGPVGDLAKKLATRELIRVVPRGLPGGISYVQLETKACVQLGLPTERSKPLGAAAIEEHIQINVACLNLLGSRRYRLENRELEKLIGRSPKNAHHAVSDEFNHPVVLRVLTSASKDYRQAAKKLDALIEKALANKRLAAAVRARDYGFLLLTSTESKKQQLERAIDQVGAKKVARILVQFAPDSSQLASYFRATR